MRSWAAAAALMVWASPALAQHAGHGAHGGYEMEQKAEPSESPMAAMPGDGHASHAGHAMPADNASPIPQAPPPPEALAGPAHAADTLFPPGEIAPARRAAHHHMGAATSHLVMFDRLEWQAGEGEDTLLWDVNARIGGDLDRLWFKSEGEIASSGNVEEAELQALWSHAVSPWFDLQAGLRYDIRPRPDRAHLVLGIEGLAPYFFEVDAAAFLSEKGDLTARIEAEYDLRLTEKLIAQPRVELGFSARNVPSLGLGSGFTALQAGLRLRYEFVREVAPYVGVEWQRDLGRTARFTRASGEQASRIVFVAGLRAWF